MKNIDQEINRYLLFVETMSSVTNNLDMVTELPFLPCEILSRVFSYLPLMDRKKVKLICKLWYNGATHPSIRRNEKLVFRNDENLIEVAEFLIRRDFAPLNLEFNDLLVDYLPPHFWRSCGHKVVTLFINSQNWNLKTMESMIEWCINLETLQVNMKITDPDYESSEESDLIYKRLKTENEECMNEFSKFLDDFIRKGVKRPNLRTFIWFFEDDDYQLTEDFLRKLFLVFPQIKNFSLGATGEIYDSCYYMNGENYPYPLELDKCLNPALKLENIAFKVPMNGNWIRNSISKREWASRLKKFEGSYEFPSPSKTRDSDIAVLFEFFKAQNYLEEIILTIYPYDDISAYVHNLLFSVLEWCPHLKVLDISVKKETTLDLAFEEAEKFFFLISNLKSLRTNDLCIRFNFPSTLMASSKLPNFALDELVLKHDRSKMDENFCSTILKHSLRLKHLELFVHSVSMLTELFQNVEVESLILVFDASFAAHRSTLGNILGFIITDRFTAQITELLMKRLSKLKTLGFMNGDNSDFEPLRINVLHELQLPNLKTFILDLLLFSEELSEETLSRLATNLSGLETLNVICAVHLQNPVKFFEQFKCLTNLTIDDKNVLDIKTMEYLFQTLPHLNSITSPEKLFFFNRFTNKISSQMPDYEWRYF